MVNNEHGLPARVVMFVDQRKLNSTSLTYTRIEDGWLLARQENSVFDSTGAELVTSIIVIDSVLPTVASNDVDVSLFIIGRLAADVLAPKKLYAQECETKDPREACQAEALHVAAAEAALVAATIAANIPAMIAAGIAVVATLVDLRSCLKAQVRANEACSLGPVLYDIAWVDTYINNELTNYISECIANAGGDPNVVNACNELENERWQLASI